MDSQERLLANAGKRLKARKLAEQQVHSDKAELPDPRDLDPLHGVTFASGSARAHAMRKGLTWRSFAASIHTPASPRGYTKEDVTLVHEESGHAAT